MIPTEASGSSDPPGRQFPCRTLSLARGEQGVRAARRLRHHVFPQRTGDRPDTSQGHLGIDGLDPRCDRLLAEADFVLSQLAAPRDELVEFSRACLHPAHRDRTLVASMALGVATHATGRGHPWTGGNCRAPGGDRRQTAPGIHQVVPRRPLPPVRTAVAPDLALFPPPARGALPLGAGVCGPPGWSPRFGTAAVCSPHSLRRTAPAHLQQLPYLARDF